MQSDHKLIILDFYRLMYKDEAIAKSYTAAILGRIETDVFTFREWVENSLTYSGLTPDLRMRLEDALKWCLTETTS